MKQSESLGMQRQLQIYLAGMAQQKPETPVSYEALREKARAVMTPDAGVVA